MDRLDPQLIVQAAELLLSQRFECPVRLAFREICAYADASLALRCSVMPLAAALPDSLIIKVARESFGPYLPDSAMSSAAQHLFNDWAAYQFLGSRPETARLAPRFYGGDREFGLILLEDLNDSDLPNTYEALLGNDRDCAAEALVEHAALLGCLHGSTQGYHPQYQALRQSLGPTQPPDRPFNGPWTCARQSPFPHETIHHAVQRYRDCFSTLGITLRIPKPIVLEMEKTYFAAWKRSVSAPLSEEAFRQAMGNACARCHVFHVLSRVPDALKADRERGLSTIRQQVIAWLQAFADLAEETGQYPGLQASVQIMAGRLKQLWPSDCHNPPYYPAFQ